MIELWGHPSDQFLSLFYAQLFEGVDGRVGLAQDAEH